MAVRFTVAGDKLTRSTGVLDDNAPYTWMGWFYPTVNTNFEEYLLIENAAGSTQNIDAFQRQGTTGQYNLVAYVSGTPTNVQGGTITNNQWVHLTMVRESVTVLKGYADGVLVATVTTGTVAGRTAAALMGLGDVHGGIPFYGRVAGQKAWSVALTAAEIAREVETLRPIRTTSLYGVWPMFQGSNNRLVDYSGNTRLWTAAGTFTDEDQPPVPWGAKVYSLSPPAPLVRIIPTLTIPTVVPAPTVTFGVAGRTITPSPVTVPLVVPAAKVNRTIKPNPVVVPLAVPSASISIAGGPRVISPNPVVVPVLPVAPVLVKGAITRSPAPVTIPVTIPSAKVTRVIKPAPVVVALATPAPALVKTKTILPSPVAIPLAVPAVTRVQGARIIRPDPVPVRLELPAPAVSGFFSVQVEDQVLVDWNQDGDFSDPEDNITPYIRAWVIDRGRDSPNALAGRCLAGRFEALLDNRDGRFSEFNADGAYFGSIHTGVPIRVNITTPAAGVQFEGQIEMITPVSALGGDHTATLVAYGPLGAFAEDAAGGSGNDVSTAYFSNLYTGQAAGHILDAAGWSATKRTLATGAQPLATWWADSKNPLELLRELEDVEQGFLWESKDGKIVWEDRYYRYTLTSVATYSDAPGSPLSYLPLSSLSPARAIVNVVEVVVEPPTAGASSVIVLWTGQTPMPIEAGESVTLIAVADLSLVAGAFAVSSWTTPVAGTDYGAWSNADGTGTNLLASISVSVVKQAQRMYITFSNSHPSAMAFITPLQARGALVVKHNAVVIDATDEDSQLHYGRHSRQLQGGQFLPDRSNARTIADFVLEQNKTPHPSFYMPIVCGTPTHVIDLLSRDLSQRITLEASVAGTGFGVSTDFIIESVHLELPPDRVLRGRLGLSAQEVYLVGDPGSGAGFFTLDSSALDGPDILGF